MNTSGSGPPADIRAAFALLAAGRSERFGGGKLLADLEGRPVWRWAADSARTAGFTALHVITNDPDIAAPSLADGWRVHASPFASEGMAASLRAAVEATASAPRLVVALADMPFVAPEFLRALADAGTTAFVRYPGGRTGVPAAFTRPDAARLLALSGDKGAGALDWPGAMIIDPPSAETLFDIDSARDLSEARSIALRRLRAGSR